MLQQDQLINTWHSATDRPNVLVVGSGDAIYVTTAMALRNADHPCEVVCLDKVADALRLLRRGAIALVVIPECPGSEGGLELILEGLSKSRPPRFVIAVNGVPKPCVDKSPLIRLATNAPSSLRDAMLTAVAEYERGVSGNLSVRSLLEASAGFPEQLWLKVCNSDGEFSDLCLNGGRVVYAECGRLSGPAAAEKVLTWSNCLYESRELPAFLQSNMSCWLRELGRLHQPATEAPAEPVVPVMKGAPAELKEEIVDFEEPTELATLAGSEFTSEVPVVAAVPQVQNTTSGADGEGATEEPAEPSFEFPSFEEIQVEEPLDMALEMDEFGSALAEPEEPELFEFDGAVPAGPPVEELLQERVFSAAAVIAEGSSHLENCQPEAEAVFFDTLAMREIFDLSTRCAQRQQVGSPRWVEVSTDVGTIVIAPIPGSRRLLAVRSRNGFGERERRELERLQQSLEHNHSLV